MEIVGQVGARLIERQETITSIESLTAGLFVATLAEVSGISAVLPGALVTYAPAMKEQLADVPHALIENDGVVSESVALAMAQGGQKKLVTDWAISFTGVAGPAALEGHQAGTVVIGVVGPKLAMTQIYHFSGDRQAVRLKSVQAGLRLLNTLLQADK